jgi:hypothetical protein
LQTGNKGEIEGCEADYHEIDSRAGGGDDNFMGIVYISCPEYPMEINPAQERDQAGDGFQHPAKPFGACRAVMVFQPKRSKKTEEIEKAVLPEDSFHFANI